MLEQNMETMADQLEATREEVRSEAQAMRRLSRGTMFMAVLILVIAMFVSI
jgi:hypothetical protein